MLSLVEKFNKLYEIELFETFVAKVRAVQPIDVDIPTNAELSRLHMETLSPLRAETGLPVHVVYK